MSSLQGWENSDVADGEHVHVLLHLKGDTAVPQPMSRDHHARTQDASIEAAEARTDRTVLVTSTPADRGGFSEMHTVFFDHVYTNAPDVTGAALLKPYARSVCSGTPTSIVYYQGMDATVPQRRGAFDRTVSHNVGMLLAEQVVSECQAKKLQAYLGFGVFNHREGTIVDVCGMSSLSSTFLVSTKLEPSCHDGTLFPSMQEICVTGAQRASDVLRTAFAELTRLEERALVPSNATTFMSLAVAVPVRLQEGSMVRTTRLHVIDIAHMSHLRLLARVGSDPSTTPWLQKPEESGVVPPHPLPLLAFGVGMQNRCVVHATVPALTRQSAAAATVHDASRNHPVATTIQTLTRLRSVCVGASTFMQGLGLPPVVAADVPMWKAVSEQMRMRRLANSVEGNRREAMATRPPEQLSDASRAVEEVREQLAAALSNCPSLTDEALSPLAGRATWECLRSRIELVREMQLELMDASRRVEEHRQWLMQLPVVNTNGYSVVGDQTRTALLERSLRLLQEENRRQRTIFSRDVDLLQLEVTPVVEAAQAESAVIPSAQRLLHSCWTTFCKEVDPFVTGRHTNGTDATSGASLEQVVAGFASALEHDLRLMVVDGNSQQAPAHESSRVQPTFNVAAAREYYRLVSLGIAKALGLQRSLAHNAPDDPDDKTLDGQWHEVITQRIAAQSDSSRVRHVAECLALQVQRMIDHTNELLKELRQIQTSDHPSSHEYRSSTAAVISRRTAQLTLRERVAESLQEEIRNSAERERLQPIAARHEPQLALAVEKLRSMYNVTMDIALGYAEGHVTNEPLAASMVGLLRDRRSANNDTWGEDATEEGGASFTRNSATNLTLEKDDEPQAERQRIPTLHVSLDDLLQGRRASVQSENIKMFHANTRRAAVQQGFFSSQTSRRKKSPRAPRGANTTSVDIDLSLL